MGHLPESKQAENRLLEVISFFSNLLCCYKHLYRSSFHILMK